MQYTHKQWAKLTEYVDDGRPRMPNNLTENAIRPFVVGRNDWLFSDTVAGANASVNLNSPIETAKANYLKPYTYVRTMFAKLPPISSVEAIKKLGPVSAKLEGTR